MNQPPAGPPEKRPIPRHVVLQIAGAAVAHERTVFKVIRGEPVRGAVYFRIREEIIRRGYSVPDPQAA